MAAASRIACAFHSKSRGPYVPWCRARIALGARITGSDWLDGGLTPADAISLTKALKEAGLDYVDVSSGGLTAEARNPTTPGYNVPIADEVRRATGIATRTVGLIVTPKDADADHRRGQGGHGGARPCRAR